MRKSSVILAGAVCFDLGVMVVPSQAAADMFLKIDSSKGAKSEEACVNKGGTVVEKGRHKYCKTTKPDAPAKTKK